jgi:outer membrane autotransporter protein
VCSSDLIVTMNGGSVTNGNLHGGYSDSGAATHNTITISSSASMYGTVYGGRSDSGTATHNTVTISSSASMYGIVYGGSSGSGTVTDNTVAMNGGTVYNNLYGGISNSGAVSGNIVTMNGGTVIGTLYGGFNYSSNPAAAVTDNIVTMNGGKVTGSLYGGYNNGSGAAATGNTVIIGGSADISDVSRLYGGYSPNADPRTGNTLHLNDWRGSTQAAVANFEHYRFTLPANIADGDSILTLTGSGSANLGANAKVAVALAGDPAALDVGERVYLINARNSSGFITGSVDNTPATPATFGATDYSFDVALEDEASSGSYNLLTATLLGKKIKQDKAKAYLDGASARLGALASGADHLLSVLDELEPPRCGVPANGTRHCSFVSIQGNNVRNRTGAGASIKHKGASFLLGGALDTENRLGTLTAGLFAESGLGNYDSHGRFGRGDGDTRHHGLGAFAKQTFANRFYLEGAIRLGRARTDYGGKGSAADLRYRSEANYWGAHAGAGHDHPLGKTGSLDTYARLLWTHQNSDTVTTRAGEELSFDAADSLRSRLGVRYRRVAGKTLRAHAGLGWEYEFDGRGRGKLDGARIAGEPETRGHSALIEAGTEWSMTRNWRLNANATALFGQRKGLGGLVQASYYF